jgi:hypothetical protein
MIVNDPSSDAQIDVTGWDLDYLNVIIGNLRWDLLAGVERELTDDETEALSLTFADTGLSTVWGTEHRRVREAADYWGAIVDEAIFQRDLPKAMARKAAGGQLLPHEWLAYDRYQRDIAEG